MIADVFLGLLAIVTIGTATALEISNLKRSGRKVRDTRPGRLILF